DGEGDQRQPPVDGEHDGGHDDEVEKIVDDGQHAGGKHVVDGVHIGGEAGDQAADGVSVKEADVHALHVAEDVAAQVEHDLLAGPLHQVGLDKLKEIGGEQSAEPDCGQLSDALPGVGRQAAREPVGCGARRAGEVAVDCDFHQVG